jgi:uncharacterized protein
LYDARTNAILRVDSPVWYRIMDLVNHEHEISNQDRKFLHSISLKGGGIYFETKPKIFFDFNKNWLKKIIDQEIKQLTLFITEKCNFKCSYCIYGSSYPDNQINTERSMSWDIAKRSIDYYLAHSRNVKTKSISFYGGEPFLEFEIIKKCVDYFLEKSDSKEAVISITTNGSLLTPENIRFLVDKNVDLLISVDGPEKVHDLHRQYKNNKGTFQSVLKNLQYIYDHYPDYFKKFISTNSVVSPQSNINEVYCFFRMNTLFRATRNTISYVRSFGTNRFFNELEADDISKKFSEREEFKNLFIDRAINGTLKDDWTLNEFFGQSMKAIRDRTMHQGFNQPIYPNGICIPGARRIVIMPGGEIYFCDQAMIKEPIGNISTGINIEKVKQFIDHYVSQCQEDCTKCWAIRLCNSCFVHQYDGKLNRKLKEANCLLVRKILHQDLITYCSILEQNPEAFDHL